jgi:anti-sigma factor RsiW
MNPIDDPHTPPPSGDEPSGPPRESRRPEHHPGVGKPGCDHFAEVAAELALGALTGAERSAALAHLEHCEDCRALLRDYSATSDLLLLAAPEVDPPAGFEVRLLDRLHASGWAADAKVVPLRRRPRPAIAAAAAVLLLAGAGIGIGIGLAAAPSQGHETALRTATLRSTSGADAGQVAVSAGSPSWLFMNFHQSDLTGWVYCVVTAGGVQQDLGTFWVHDGSGSWAAPLSSPGHTVSEATVEGPTGSVLATAELTG